VFEAEDVGPELREQEMRQREKLAAKS